MSEPEKAEMHYGLPVSGLPLLPRAGEINILITIRDRALAELNLTQKETEVAHLLLKGLSTMDMVRIVGKTDQVLKDRIFKIFTKAGVHSRAEFFHFIFPT